MRLRLRRYSGVGVLLSVMFAASADAASITLAWDPAPAEPVSGYRVYHGTAPGVYTESVDAGLVTQYTWNALQEGVWHYFAVRAYNNTSTSPLSAEVYEAAPITSALPAAWPVYSIYWHNQSTGALLAWTMKGNSLIRTRNLSVASVDPSWQLVAVSDYDGDGTPDLFWRQQSTGAVEVWLMSGDTKLQAVPLAGYSLIDPEWQFAGVADANGDGHPDLLWQHQERYLNAWFMNGSTMLGVFPVQPYWADPSWRIGGIADFTGDGAPDIVWYHLDGWLSMWKMEGLKQDRPWIGMTPVDFPTNYVGAGWDLLGVRDVDGDGQPDLLWRNETSGALGAWRMNGVNYIDSLSLVPATAPAPSWKISAVH